MVRGTPRCRLRLAAALADPTFASHAMNTRSVASKADKPPARRSRLPLRSAELFGAALAFIGRSYQCFSQCSGHISSFIKLLPVCAFVSAHCWLCGSRHALAPLRWPGRRPKIAHWCPPPPLASADGANSSACGVWWRRASGASGTLDLSPASTDSWLPISPTPGVSSEGQMMASGRATHYHLGLLLKDDRAARRTDTLNSPAEAEKRERRRFSCGQRGPCRRLVSERRSGATAACDPPKWRHGFIRTFRGAFDRASYVTTVPARTLSSCSMPHSMTSVDFLALDVEGYEEEALRDTLDLTGTLKSDPCRDTGRRSQASRDRRSARRLNLIRQLTKMGLPLRPAFRTMTMHARGEGVSEGEAIRSGARCL